MADDDKAYGFDRIDAVPTPLAFRNDMQAIVNDPGLLDYQKYLQALKLCMSVLWALGYRDGLEIMQSLPMHTPFQEGTDGNNR